MAPDMQSVSSHCHDDQEESEADNQVFGMTARPAHEPLRRIDQCRIVDRRVIGSTGNACATTRVDEISCTKTNTDGEAGL